MAEDPSLETGAPSSGRGREVLFPGIYTWFVFLAAMDVMMTTIVLYQGGVEVNAVADWFIRRWGVWGMVLLKFIVVAVVVGICEGIGRRDLKLARRVAEWAVALNTIPVTIAFVQLLYQRFG